MIRVFRFKNSFMSEKPESVPATYSVFGRYDGMDMEVYQQIEDEKLSEIFGDPLHLIYDANKMSEMYDEFSVIGFRDKDDAYFWEQGGKPYIFISCIQLKEKSRKLEEIKSRLEEEVDAVCYTSFDSSDLIICIRTANYKLGYNTIIRYDQEIKHVDEHNGLKKVVSEFCIWQDVLDGISRDTVSEKAQDEIREMEEETISCILRLTVQDQTEFDSFKEKLKETLGHPFIDIYGVLGSEDIVIYIKNILSKKLLALYGKNRLLTHSCESYQKALFNISTEILAER